MSWTAASQNAASVIAAPRGYPLQNCRRICSIRHVVHRWVSTSQPFSETLTSSRQTVRVFARHSSADTVGRRTVFGPLFALLKFIRSECHISFKRFCRFFRSRKTYRAINLQLIIASDLFTYKQQTRFFRKSLIFAQGGECKANIRIWRRITQSGERTDGWPSVRGTKQAVISPKCPSFVLKTGPSFSKTAFPKYLVFLEKRGGRGEKKTSFSRKKEVFFSPRNLPFPPRCYISSGRPPASTATGRRVEKGMWARRCLRSPGAQEGAGAKSRAAR